MSEPAPLPHAAPEDASHLKLLGVFYYVFAGLNALSVVLIALYAAIITAVFANVPTRPGEPGPEVFAGLVVGVCVALVVLSAVCGVLQYMAGRRLREYRARGFCQIVAGLSCLSIPIGTVLGVFTFVVLNRPSVRALFQDRR